MRPRIYSLSAFRIGLTAARFLPRSAGQFLAPLIGLRCYRENPEKRDALRQNLRTVTGLDGAPLDALCEENVANFSRMLADYFYCASRGESAAGNLQEEWQGAEHLESARAAGRGMIVVTGHLGNWELGGILLALRGIPMTVVTLDEPTTALTEWRDAYRRKLGIKTIAVGPGREFSFVEMIQTLRRGECLAMLVDRPYGSTGAPVRIFQRELQFSTAPALLWQHTGAPVIPAFVLRRPDGRYLSIAEPAVPMETGTDQRSGLAANTQAVASIFESIIRQYPEQWFNYVSLWPTTSNDNGNLSIHV
jgi:lauroyl/myristoyl acyltransferase